MQVHGTRSVMYVYIIHIFKGQVSDTCASFFGGVFVNEMTPGDRFMMVYASYHTYMEDNTAPTTLQNLTGA